MYHQIIEGFPKKSIMNMWHWFTTTKTNRVEECKKWMAQRYYVKYNSALSEINRRVADFNDSCDSILRNYFEYVSETDS